MYEEALRRIALTKKENLEYLDLSSLGLEQIPKELLSVSGIKALSLSHNSLKDISVLVHLTQLHKLALTDNKIEDISVLSGLLKLRFLFLADNSVRDLSAIHGQKRLKKLVIANNKISSLSEMGCFESLAYFDIRANPLDAPSFEAVKKCHPVLKIYKV